MLVEDGYKKMHVDGSVRWKDSGNKEQLKAEKERRKLTNEKGARIYVGGALGSLSLVMQH